MSDGKRYALQFVNQSADEIIAEIQRKFDVIIGRLQAYDHLIQSHEQLQKSVTSIEQKVEAFPEKFEKQGGVISVVLSTMLKENQQVNDRLKDIQSSSTALSQDLENNGKDFEAKLSYVHSRITDVRSTANKNESAIDRLFEKIEDNKTKQEEFNRSIKESDNKLDKHELVHQQLSNKIGSTEDKMRALLDQFNNKFSSLLELESKFKESQREIESKILRLNVNVRDEMQRLSLSLEGRHKENLDSLEAHKAECKKTISDNFIDINNTKIRFENINKQLILLEKKIENINLLLKKYELDK